MSVESLSFNIARIAESYIEYSPRRSFHPDKHRNSLITLHRLANTKPMEQRTSIIDSFVYAISKKKRVKGWLKQIREIIESPPQKLKPRLELLESKYPGISHYIPLIIYEDLETLKHAMLTVLITPFALMTLNVNHPNTLIKLGRPRKSKATAVDIISEKFSMNHEDRKALVRTCTAIELHRKWKYKSLRL